MALPSGPSASTAVDGPRTAGSSGVHVPPSVEVQTGVRAEPSWLVAGAPTATNPPWNRAIDLIDATGSAAASGAKLSDVQATSSAGGTGVVKPGSVPTAVDGTGVAVADGAGVGDAVIGDAAVGVAMAGLAGVVAGTGLGDGVAVLDAQPARSRTITMRPPGRTRPVGLMGCMEVLPECLTTRPMLGVARPR